jgi:hypothetical protein
MQRVKVSVFLAARLSSSRVPCLGRSLWSRRMRSASPNLDTAATLQESAPIEDDAAEQDLASRAAVLRDLGVAGMT